MFEMTTDRTKFGKFRKNCYRNKFNAE